MLYTELTCHEHIHVLSNLTVSAPASIDHGLPPYPAHSLSYLAVNAPTSIDVVACVHEVNKKAVCWAHRMTYARSVAQVRLLRSS